MYSFVRRKSVDRTVSYTKKIWLNPTLGYNERKIKMARLRFTNEE